MLKEFKEFALKGNAIELAVGVVIGGAFQGIINSLVNDIIMPLLSIPTGKVDFSELNFYLGNTKIPYGNFISAIVNFLIIAFSLFLAIKYINHLNKKIEKAKIEESKLLLNLKGKSKIIKKMEKEKNKKSKKSEDDEILSTKLCPYCFSEININAIKCPHCTSDIREDG